MIYIKKYWKYLGGLVVLAAIITGMFTGGDNDTTVNYQIPGYSGDNILENMNNTKIRYQCTGSVCGQVAGPSSDYTAGETLAWPNLCTRSGTNNKIYKADADTIGRTAGQPMVCITGCNTNTATCEFLLEGQVNYTGWSLSEDTYYFAATQNAISGVVLSTSGQQVRVAGYPIDSNSFYFDPGETIVEID